MTRVLVVDEDTDTREMLRDILADCGYNVYGVPGAHEALALLRASPVPVVVVADVGSPDDGLTLLRAVHADAALASRHCYLALTAWPPERLNLSAELVSILVAPVMSKPFQLDDFLAAVVQAAEKLPTA